MASLGKDLCHKISAMKDAAEKEGDAFYVGKRVHSATAVPFFKETSTKCLSDVGDAIGAIPVSQSGRAVLYDMLDQPAAKDEKEQHAPQWYCSDVLCKLPAN